MKKTVLVTLIIIFIISPLLGYPDSPPSGSPPEGGIGGSASPFLSESFQTDLATGAATLSIPITVPPGRKNMQPSLALSYSSNNGNGICGVGWAIPTNSIQRSTKKGVPTYNNADDTFAVAAAGSNAELVEIAENEYRARVESAFMKYEYIPNAVTGDYWEIYDKSGTKYTFGKTSASRIEDSGRTFSWYLDEVRDVYGNYITYIYEKPGDGQVYLKEIQYTGNDTGPLAPDKSIIFTYIDRTDKLFNYRSGWEIVTSKLLDSIEVRLDGAKVWLYKLTYIPSGDTDRSLLQSITVYDKDNNSLPPKTFTYQTLE